MLYDQAVNLKQLNYDTKDDGMIKVQKKTINEVIIIKKISCHASKFANGILNCRIFELK